MKKKINKLYIFALSQEEVSDTNLIQYATSKILRKLDVKIAEEYGEDAYDYYIVKHNNVKLSKNIQTGNYEYSLSAVLIPIEGAFELLNEVEERLKVGL